MKVGCGCHLKGSSQLLGLIRVHRFIILFSLTVNMHGIVSFEVPTLPKMCTIIVTVQADTQMSKVAFSIRMRALLPFTGVLQDRNKYLLVSMYHLCCIHLYRQDIHLL